MGAVLGVGREQRGHVNDALDAVGVDGLHQLGQLGDIAPVELDPVEIRLKVGARRGEVEADHLLAAFQQLADYPVADEPGPAGHHY